jgi:hypothetical protein
VRERAGRRSQQIAGFTQWGMAAQLASQPEIGDIRFTRLIQLLDPQRIVRTPAERLILLLAPSQFRSHQTDGSFVLFPAPVEPGRETKSRPHAS